MGSEGWRLGFCYADESVDLLSDREQASGQPVPQRLGERAHPAPWATLNTEGYQEVSDNRCLRVSRATAPSS